MAQPYPIGVTYRYAPKMFSSSAIFACIADLSTVSPRSVRWVPGTQGGEADDQGERPPRR